jgi:hypothetical protein
MRQRALFILLFLSSLSFVPALPAPVRIACGFIQAFYVPGFVFMLFFWDRRSPALDTLFIPPVLSPVVLSLLTAGTFVFTHSVGASVTVSMIILYALLLIGLARERGRVELDAPEKIPSSAVIFPLLFCGMVGIFYVLNRYVLLRSDTFVHAPIVGEILDRGIPPLDPRLPHAAIRYPWFYHLFAACVVRLAGLSVFGALGLLNVMSTFAFPYVVARLAARFTRRAVHIVSAQFIAVAGLGSASWILWPVVLLRTLTGEVKGLAEVARILGQIDLNSYRVVYFLTPSWTLMVNVPDRFFTVSPFNHAIDLFLLCFMLVLSRDAQRRAPVRTAVGIVFVIVGAFLMHVVSGVALILTSAGAGILLMASRLLRIGERPDRFQTLVVPALALLAGILCLPYFKSLTGGEGERVAMQHYLYFGTANFLTIVAPLVGLFFIIGSLVRYLLHVEISERAALGAWMIVLFFINICINLPGQAELKFALLFLAFLGLPTSIMLVDWLASAKRTRRAFALVWLTILFVVPMVLTGRGFLLDAPTTGALRNACAPSADRLNLYEWIHTQTPVTSVVAELSDDNYTPLYAHRHTFVQWSGLNSLLGYAGGMIDRDTAIRDEIFSEKPLPEPTVDHLRSLEYDLYVIVWADDRTSHPYLEGKLASLKSLFAKVYENPAGEVYRLSRSSARSQ